jgi:hypothetical protein
MPANGSSRSATYSRLPPTAAPSRKVDTRKEPELVRGRVWHAATLQRRSDVTHDLRIEVGVVQREVPSREERTGQVHLGPAVSYLPHREYSVDIRAGRPKRRIRPQHVVLHGMEYAAVTRSHTQTRVVPLHALCTFHELRFSRVWANCYSKRHSWRGKLDATKVTRDNYLFAYGSSRVKPARSHSRTENGPALLDADPQAVNRH